MDPRKSFVRAALTRFAFLYWLLYSVIVVWASQVAGFDWIGEHTAGIQDSIVQWVGHDVVGIDYEFSSGETGSGDKTSDWVWLLIIATLAIAGSLVWTVLDKRRARDGRIREATRIVVRYTLSLVILGYGVSKVFAGQFPVPDDSRLHQTYGDSSPMGLMWTFMGASPMYVIFAGAAETFGSVLLWFRRTTTLGAMVLSVVMFNVAMMNFCYDVPVKLNSTHYLIMAVYLIAPDLRRLVEVLVLDRGVPASGRPALALPKRWQRIAVIVLRVAVVGWVAYNDLEGAWPRSSDALDRYEGSWAVDTFARDGQDVPVSTSPDVRWNRVKFQTYEGTKYVRWSTPAKRRGDLYVIAIDETAHTMTWNLADDSGKPKPGAPPIVFHVTQATADDLALDGTIDGHATAVHAKRSDPSKFLLMSRGFHWISEAPFNR